jgi:hypothetical protein
MRGDDETRVVGRDDGLRAGSFVRLGEQLGYAAVAVESMASAVRGGSIVLGAVWAVLGAARIRSES